MEIITHAMAEELGILRLHDDPMSYKTCGRDDCKRLIGRHLFETNRCYSHGHGTLERALNLARNYALKIGIEPFDPDWPIAIRMDFDIPK